MQVGDGTEALLDAIAGDNEAVRAEVRRCAVSIAACAGVTVPTVLGYIAQAENPCGPCRRPVGHPGGCGPAVFDDETEGAVLYGRCGAPPAPTATLFAGGQPRPPAPPQRYSTDLRRPWWAR